MKTTQDSHAASQVSIGQIVALPLMARILTDTGFQILFPFISIWAQGLGVTTLQMGRLIGFRNLTGLAAPIWGTLADRYGYRRFLQAELLFIAIGQLLLAYSTVRSTQITGLMLTGVATFALIPTLQAYISTRLPYEIRGRGMGIMEYGWALAGILGVFSTGWIIERINWQAPFLLLALGMIALSFVFRTLPGRTSGTRRSQPGVSTSWLYAFRQWLMDAGIGSTSARTTLFMGTLISYGLMNTVFVYGIWLSAEYDTSATTLGTVALAMGFADLGGSVMVTFFTDRIGKKRSVLLGSLLACVALMVLPVLNISLTTSVIGLMLMRFMLEFTLISFFVFASEQAPGSRGAMLSLTGAFSFGGGSLAGFTGPWLYERMGILGPCVTSTVGMALVVLLGLLFLRDADTARRP